MKKMMLILQLLAANVPAGYCQPADVKASQMMVAQRLDICARKTTNLIFPSAIKSVDRGSADILAQKPDGVENVLKVKAAREYFLETNLTVITADGQFYSFMVGFANDPVNLVIQANARSTAAPVPKQAIFSDAANNEDMIAQLSTTALTSKRNIHGIHDKTSQVEFTVKGLYTAHNLFFYKLELDNHSNIDYGIHAIRFFTEDKKKVKRTASQQVTLEPIVIKGVELPIKGHTRRTIIAVMSKETLATDKHLLIEADEKDGGRNLICTLNSKMLLKAKPIK